MKTQEKAIKKFVGNLTITHENQKLYKFIKTIKGNLTLSENVEIDTDYLEQVNNLTLKQGASLRADNLIKCDEFDLWKRSTLEVKNLEVVQTITLDCDTNITAESLYFLDQFNINGNDNRIEFDANLRYIGGLTLGNGVYYENEDLTEIYDLKMGNKSFLRATNLGKIGKMRLYDATLITSDYDIYDSDHQNLEDYEC